MSINSDISDSDNDDDNNQVENDENICDIQADLERSTFFVNYLSNTQITIIFYLCNSYTSPSFSLTSLSPMKPLSH